MSKSIESEALDRLYRVLGLSGGAATPTLLDDGNVSMVLSINDIVRRSRTPAQQSGWIICAFQNTHGGAGEKTASIDPYSPGDANLLPYPEEVPRGFDFWILYATMLRAAGAGALDGATLEIQAGASQRGWGISDAGSAIDVNDFMVVARWTGLDSTTTVDYGIGGDGSARVNIGLRIPRGVNFIRYRSDAGAAATFRCYLFCALFPEGLGQDVAS